MEGHCGGEPRAMRGKGRSILADAGRRRTSVGGDNAAAETLVMHEAVVRALHGVDGKRGEELLVLGLRDS